MDDSQTPSSSKLCATVHRVALFRPTSLHNVKSMVYSPDKTRLAVLRRIICANKLGRLSVIEIWSAGTHIPVLLYTIHEDVDNPSSLEAITWGNNNRLFSCGGKSRFYEYDLKNKTPREFEVGGGPCWCMAFNFTRNLMAVGSNDGKVTIFEMGGSVEEVSFGKTIGVACSRVMSIAWGGTDKKALIFTGCIDYIHIWSYKKCMSIAKLLVSQGIPTVIWSLAVYKNVIIAGDSNGFTSFWCSSSQVRLNSFKTHDGDVLTVAVSDHGRVYSSGLDPKIACIAIVQDENEVDITAESILMDEPFYSRHHHDVNSLAIGNRGALLSAGNGPFFVQVTKQRKKEQSFLCHLQEHVSFDGSKVLLRFLTRLEIYLFPNVLRDPQGEPKKWTYIDTRKRIIDAVFRNNFVVYATCQKVVFTTRKLDQTTGLEQITKLKGKFNYPATSINKILFINDNHVAIVMCGEMYIVKLKSKKFKVVTIIQHGSRIQKVIPLNSKVIMISEDLAFITIDTSSWQMVASQDGLPDLVVDFCVESSGDKVWLLTADEQVVCMEYEDEGWKVDARSLRHLRLHNHYHGIATLDDILLFYTNDTIVAVNKQDLKIRACIDDYEHILAINVSSSDPASLVVVELPKETLTEMLVPPCDSKSLQPFRR